MATMPGNQQGEPVPRQDCGRWTLGVAFTVVFGLVFLYQSVSDMSTSRLLPVQDVAYKATTMLIRGNSTGDEGKNTVTSDSSSNSSSFEREGVTMSFSYSSKPRLPRQKGTGRGDEVKKAKNLTNSFALSSARNEDAEISDEVIGAYREYMKGCTSVACLNSVKQQKERWGGDLMNLVDTKRLVKEARNKWIEQLKRDYGEDNYYNLFEVNGSSRGRKAFLSANNESETSILRFKRKLKIKILTVQTAIQAERESLKEESSRRSLEADHDDPDYYQKFVWATGGHSAAAGHGNLFNESYTAFMDRAVSDIFGAIGIDFEARNHAMGGTASSPEISLCNEAIFGTDADVISWDFGMTDANWFFRKAMYNQRIGLNPNRPAIIDLNVGGREFKVRSWMNQHVENRGLTSIYLDPDEVDKMETMIPDTFGLPKDQVEAMPNHIRHFKCQGAVEKGDPTCRDYKYSNLEFCPNRKGMTSWHPGWKRMALTGNIVALFLIDMLSDAIAELGASTGDRIDLLAQLRSEEDKDYDKFLTSFSPDNIEYNMVPLDDDLVDDSNVSVFFRKPSICHTARLPSQTRHLGILTMSDQIGVHDYEYFKGIPMAEAKRITNENDDTPKTIPLVYDEDLREDCDEAELNRDFMDYFLVTSRMGPRFLTIPNDAERQAYGRESEKPQGIVALCIPPCPWGQCPEGELQLQDVVNGTLQIDINGQPVTNVTDFRGCSVLRGENGHRFQANDAGQYVVKAHVPSNRNSTLSFIRISSFVVL